MVRRLIQQVTLITLAGSVPACRSDLTGSSEPKREAVASFRLTTDHIEVFSGTPIAVLPMIVDAEDAFGKPVTIDSVTLTPLGDFRIGPSKLEITGDTILPLEETAEVVGIKVDAVRDTLLIVATYDVRQSDWEGGAFCTSPTSPSLPDSAALQWMRSPATYPFGGVMVAMIVFRSRWILFRDTLEIWALDDTITLGWELGRLRYSRLLQDINGGTLSIGLGFGTLLSEDPRAYEGGRLCEPFWRVTENAVLKATP
jgi:hypothetical protein